MKKREKSTSPLSQITLSSKFDFDKSESENEEENDEKGLKSGIKATTTNQNAPIGSTEVEGFLKELKTKLIEQVTKEKLVNKPRDEIICNLLIKLKNLNEVVIATDKTNSFQTVTIEKYKDWVEEHLETSAKEIDIKRIIEIFDLAIEMQEKYKDLLSDQEYLFLQKNLLTKNIPTPKLIIKDHKKQNEQGEYPSRLIVPANNFTSAFPRLGYLGIKHIFDSHKIIYDRHTITQASDMKKKLEKLGIRKNKGTIAKLDIVAMYPSIQFLLVKKTVKYFSKKLPRKEKQKVNKCLKLTPPR